MATPHPAKSENRAIDPVVAGASRRVGSASTVESSHPGAGALGTDGPQLAQSRPHRERRILCVNPRFTPSFGMMEYAYSQLGGVRTLMPPQGILLIAASLPPAWEVRFVDENIRPAASEDFVWADAVFVTGMHNQRRQIEDICKRAHMFDRTAVLGGSSVSTCPGYYPDFDYLHVGELGDATEQLIERLACDPSRPPKQVVLTTVNRRPLTEFPIPAYELVDFDRYMVASIQYSSGCPYKCEFCDIPALAGRNPRFKTPGQVLAELDRLLATRGAGNLIYFVDDNFIGNRRAARELLEVLIEWQKSRGYPFRLACEATLNLAKRPDLLELMRRARFETVFCGIETPEPEALKAIAKEHNMMVPPIEAIQTLNQHGLEVVSGIILGLDTDTPDTAAHILDFIAQSRIPMVTINLLQALPHTPLWDRLEREGRLIEDEDRLSNVDFRIPYEQMLDIWRDTMARAFTPEAVHARFNHQVTHTIPNRIRVPLQAGNMSLSGLVRGLRVLMNVLWCCGVRADYRSLSWKLAYSCLKARRIDYLIHAALVANHVILAARDASAGQQNAFHWPAGRRSRSSNAPPGDGRTIWQGATSLRAGRQ